MGGAFAPRLIFARNANPGAHVLRQIILKTIFLHILLMPENTGAVQDKSAKITIFHGLNIISGLNGLQRNFMDGLLVQPLFFF